MSSPKEGTPYFFFVGSFWEKTIRGPLPHAPVHNLVPERGGSASPAYHGRNPKRVHNLVPGRRIGLPRGSQDNGLAPGLLPPLEDQGAPLIRPYPGLSYGLARVVE